MWFRRKTKAVYVPLDSVAKAIRDEERRGVDLPCWPTGAERKAREEAEERRQRFELIRGAQHG